MSLPEGHRFPIEKYAMLRERLLEMVPADRIDEPDRVSIEDIRRVHTAHWADRLLEGTLTDPELRRLGFPWSPALVERALRAAGGTCQAAEASLRDGVAMNLAGGTHHAFPDRGEGFCALNDVAIAVRRLQADQSIRRAVVIDLDVHQGNGTHAIFARDDDVYTFSMHGARNYPFHKVPGRADVELDDGTSDEVYLALLGDTLPRVLRDARADLAFYLAGADPHIGDRLGRLSLSFDGLARRDHLVLSACREIGLPVTVVIAGGYGRQIGDTVEAHVRTARAVLDFA